MIELDDYRIFVAVAREGSFVAASRKTGVPTSTVSRAVARLESRIGARLVHRTSRRVSLSSDGERLLARVGPLIDGLSTVIAETRDQTTQPAGVLRVTAPVVSGSGWVGRSLASFAEAYPRVQVELRVTNTVVDLVGDRFDLGFRGGPVEDARLVARRIWSAPNVLVASPAFVERALSGRRLVTRAQLESLPAIVHGTRFRWSFESGAHVRPGRGRSRGARPRYRARGEEPGAQRRGYGRDGARRARSRHALRGATCRPCAPTRAARDRLDRETRAAARSYQPNLVLSAAASSPPHFAWVATVG